MPEVVLATLPVFVPLGIFALLLVSPRLRIKLEAGLSEMRNEEESSKSRVIDDDGTQRS